MKPLTWLLSAALLCTGVGAHAKIVYVNRNASGSAPDGVSWATAFPKLSAGFSSAASGDEVWVARGTYQERVKLAPPKGVSVFGGFSGSESRRDERCASANVSIIEPTDSTSAGLVIENANVTVDGFTIRRAGYGLSAIGGDARVSHCVISGCENGVRISAGTLKVESCAISNSTFALLVAGGKVALTGSRLSGKGQNYPDGNLVKGFGVYLFGGLATLCGNVISNHTADAVTVNAGSALLVGNAIISNVAGGVTLTGGSVSLSNNIVAANGGKGVTSTAAASVTAFSHNDVFGNRQGDYAGFTPPANAGNLSVDPKLANAFDDPHIQPDSPCRDAGDPAADIGAVDIDGQPRVQGAAVDIGADESDGTTWSPSPVIWHVSPNGNDEADGLTWGTAKRTILAALVAANGGDEVWVAAGTYAERICPGAGVALYGGFSGSEARREERNWHAHPVTLSSSGYVSNPLWCGRPGVVVDGFRLRDGAYAQIAADALLANNDIAGSYVAGVVVSAGASATLTNNVITRSHDGVQALGSVSAVGNVISRNQGHGVLLDHGVGILSGNDISANELCGVMADHATFTMVSNTLVGSGDDGVRCAYGTALLQGNIITRSDRYGVYLDLGVVATLNNNTIAHCGGSGAFLYYATVSLTNDILAFNGGYGFERRSGQVPAFSHNDVYGNASGAYAVFTPPADAGNISADPFLSTQSRAVHIQPGSPCMNAGDAAVVAGGDVDIDGQPRVQGASVDIGADESDGTTWTTEALILRVAPEGSDAADGRTWATAKKTISGALSDTGVSEVWVARGEYEDSFSPSGVALYGGFAGFETDRSQRDWIANPTCIHCPEWSGAPLISRYAGTSLDGFTLHDSEYGVYALASSGTILTNVRLLNNTASGVLAQGSVALSQCVIAGNADYGILATEGGLHLEACVVAGNGAGVYVPTAASLKNCTVADNLADGIKAAGVLILSNAIVAGNLGYGVVAVDGASVIGFSRNDVFGNGAGDFLGFTPPADGGAISLDPLFIDRANGNYRLQTGSPCIDAGDDALVFLGATDADGNPRISGPHVDMGAYEYNAATAPFVPADVNRALRIAAGLIGASAGDAARLNVAAGAGVDLADAVSIARKAAGLDANP